ncbi:hypothetical protein [Paracoccus marinaquae]|uniref:Uncharacterized protein n=1 Tax=Paracoccus marinaquae TaxID=2841926 RepID=A0ABS6AMN0_9RHOB|nr:hypothetical protein [Paracoccus marinaquae]MBU3031102.1 hypothetical protein [Paracoccus marinaquae]
MRVPRLIAAAALSASVAGAAAQAPDPDFGGGARVQLALSDVAGAPIDRPAAGVPFRVTVRLGDPDSGRPVEDEHLSGWIRPVEASNTRCRDAARSYFVNQGALPRGSTDLGRSLYGIRHEDNTVSIVDWEHSLASANILAMVRLSGAPGPLVPQPEAFAFAAPTGQGGRVQIVAAEGTEARALPDLDGDSAMVVAANGWMARERTLIRPDGSAAPQLPATVLALQPAFADVDEGLYDGVLVLMETGLALPVRQDEAAPRTPVRGPDKAISAGYAEVADAVLFADGSDRLTVVYGGSRRIIAPLPAPASRISVAPDGRLALAWSPDSAAVSIVEVATASVVQAIELNRAPVAQPVREVAFAEDGAFLLLERLDFVMVVDLELAKRGEPAAVRAVRIGPPVTDLPPGSGPFLIETARGHSGGTVLALHPDLSSAFPVMRDSGNATAPMNGFRIRGGRPLTLAELAGGLREVAPGDYRATTVLAYGGPYELVVSAGPGRFTACARFEVQGDVAAGLALRLRASTSPQGADRLALDLQIVDEAGLTQRWPAELPLILQSLETGWRDRVVARPQATGGHRVVIGGVPAGQVSIALDRRLPPGISITPATIEVSR